MRSRIEVAKLLATVTIEGRQHLLLSRKRAHGEQKHGQLELLGGRLDDDPPFEGLLRELEEEEDSGLLAELVASRRPTAERLELPGAVYHVYRLEIDPDDLGLLVPHESESLGFELVPTEALADPGFWVELTERTVQTLARLEFL